MPRRVLVFSLARAVGAPLCAGAAMASSLLATAASAPADARTAQTLELGGAPPTLPEENAASRLAKILQEEIRSLESQAASGPDGTVDADVATVVAARVAARRLSFELLARGREPGGRRDAVALHGFRIADTRRRIDVAAESLVRAPDPGVRPLSVQERSRAIRLLARFADGAPKAIAGADLTDLGQVDAAVATALAPLLDVLAIVDGRGSGTAITTGWPSAGELARSGSGAAVAPAPRPQTPDIAPSSAGEPGKAPSGAPEGQSGDEALPPAIARAIGETGTDAASVPEAAAGLARAAARAVWLSEVQREAIATRAATLVASHDSDALALAEAQRRLLEAVTALLARDDAPKGPDRERLVGAAVVATVEETGPAEAVDAASPPAPRRSVRAIARVTDVVQTAISFRTRPDVAVARDMKAALSDARRRYSVSESAVMRELDSLLGDSNTLASPEWSSLIDAQREALADLGRCERAEGIVERIGGARPQAARGVSTQVRKLIRSFGEPNRRADARRTFDALESQSLSYVPLPFEESLRREGADALRLSGGEPRKLGEVIDVARAEWADAWALGEGAGVATDRMHRLWRLMRLMESLADDRQSTEGRDTASILSRWGGFLASRGSLAPALVDVDALTKLATAAAIAGDDAGLSRQLDRLERDAPLVRLTGELMSHLRTWLESRPDGALGALAAASAPPEEDAWALPVRTDLATLLRMARELEDQRRTGDRSREREVLEFMSKLADDLVVRLRGASRTTLGAGP